MKLDNEEQRQQLLQIIRSVQISGNMDQVKEIVNSLTTLLMSIKNANIGE